MIRDYFGFEPMCKECISGQSTHCLLADDLNHTLICMYVGCICVARCLWKCNSIYYHRWSSSVTAVRCITQSPQKGMSDVLIIKVLKVWWATLVEMFKYAEVKLVHYTTTVKPELLLTMQNHEIKFICNKRFSTPVFFSGNICTDLKEVELAFSRSIPMAKKKTSFHKWVACPFFCDKRRLERARRYTPHYTQDVWRQCVGWTPSPLICKSLSPIQLSDWLAVINILPACDFVSPELLCQQAALKRDFVNVWCLMKWCSVCVTLFSKDIQI